VYFFSTISGSISHNLDRAPEVVFFNFFPFFSGYLVPRLFAKRMFRFIQANYQTFYSNVKNASAALPVSVTSADFDLSPGTISALTGT
jgi:hypothetical protein